MPSKHRIYIDYRRYLLVLFVALFGYSPAGSQIIVSEFMYAPQQGEPEWIEIYNTSESEISLDSAYLCDASTCKKIFNLTVKPNSYIVLTNDVNFIVQKYALPNSEALHKMAIPSLNNDRDAIVLKDKNGDIIDSVYYEGKWGKSGISLERLHFDKPAISQSNLLPSIAALGATPVAENSISSSNCNFDVSANISNSIVAYSIDNNCHLVRNFGIQISIDYDKSGTFEKNELLLDSSISAQEYSKYSDSIDIANLFIYKLKGRYEILFELFGEDFDLNKKFYGYYQSQLDSRDIVINEIMPIPLPNSSEYIELYNSTADSIDLSGYRIFDESGSFSKKYMGLSDCIISPFSYFAIASDSSFFNQFPNLLNSPKVRVVKSQLTLNNTSDMVVLADTYGKTIDSLFYSVNWHDPSISNSAGISLERVLPNMETNDPKNWASSSDWTGGTPTFENTAKSITSQGSIEPHPNPFHLAKQAECELIYQLPFKQARLSIQIYSENGELVAEPANNVYSSAEGKVKWNGKGRNGENLSDGIYVVYIEAVATDTAQVFTDKSVIVLKN